MHSMELFWLFLTVLITAFMAFPYAVIRSKEQGVKTILTTSIPINTLSSARAQRAQRAHLNAIENLIIFMPLVFILHFNGISRTATVTACQIHFFSRFIYYFLYLFGVPYFRSFMFAVNFCSTMVLVTKLFCFYFF